MNKTSLKSHIHKLVDKIENQHLLEEYYREMKNIVHKSRVNAWDTLSEDQKKEVLLSYEESENDDDLLDNKSVIKKYKDWL